jgi:hypothetical protein
MIISVKNLTTCVIIYFSSILTATPCLADRIYTSRSGTLTVQYENACSTVRPSGSYRFGNISGTLTALSCKNVGGDFAEHKFIDISGDQRCYDRMNQSWGGRYPVTVWEVKGAVSGYQCSQIGEKFKIEMDNGKQL